MVSRLTADLFDWIQTKALSLGFLECATVALGVDKNFIDYKKWVDKGHHQPLEYLNNNLDKREDPRRLGEGLLSAIVFLHPYPKSWSSSMVAKYASGEDYHYIIKNKLQQLSQDFSSKWTPFKNEKICVDTIPLLERSLVQKSGLGWIGKNGCLISKKHGSFTLLSSWLISAEIPPKETIDMFHCGKCTRCLDACPTDAFIEPGKLSVEKCLSTQTIENRKIIDPRFFSAITTSAFGCDICQDVCPWNRKQLAVPTEEYLPPLNDLLLLAEKEFRDFFRNTPLTRPTWAGLKRNFLILASNDPTIPISTFELYAKHINPIIKKTASEILSILNEK